MSVSPVIASRAGAPRWVRVSFVIVLLTMACAAQGRELPAPVKRLQLDMPRSYGYVVGDRIQQELYLELTGGYRLEQTALPRPGAVARWLELRRLDMKEQAMGGARRYQISLQYQTFRAPLAVAEQAIPSFALSIAGPGGPLAVDVPASAVTVGPLQPLASKEGLPQAQPDHWPAEPDTAGPAWQTLAWTALALAGGGAWAYFSGLWPWSRRGNNFAMALRELQRLTSKPWDDATARAAYGYLHQAFNATWGEPLFAERLDDFLRQRPAYLPLRAELEAFFDASYAFFFGADAGTSSLTDVRAVGGLEQSVTRQTQEDALSRLQWLCRQCLTVERSAL